MGPQIQNFILICCFFTWRRPSKCLRKISIVFLKKKLCHAGTQQNLSIFGLALTKILSIDSNVSIFEHINSNKIIPPYLCKEGLNIFFQTQLPIGNCGSNRMNIRSFHYCMLIYEDRASFSWLRCFHRLQNVCLFLEDVVFEVRSYMPRSFLSFDDIQ